MNDDEGDSDLSSNLTSDDDLETMLNKPRKKNENYLEEIVPQYSDQIFFEHFRVSRDVVENIRQKFEESRYFHDQVGQFGNIPPLHQVLIYLWYIGHQTASFRDIGDRFNITISSVNRVINRMTLYLSNLAPEIIKWPNEVEKRISEKHFKTNGFPNIIGAIDGCHFKIDKPAHDPDSYINRKGYYSMHMQAVCNEKRQIIDIFVGYPGSVHDSRVFRTSPLQNDLKNKCGRYFLLGDSGYPLQENLLTPFKDMGTLTPTQQNYDVKLAKNRYIIEHCFGVLKQKFRQMYHIKLRNIRLIAHFIRAACVIHNIAIEDAFPLDIEQSPPNSLYIAGLQNAEDNDDVEDIGARAIRERVANLLPV